ncbi:hypothetical protein [Cloacibacterium sp. TD35]|uniref:hypothetical protein n=1 Tax=Cloacibacterium sp. TD35 TaxID=2976818 RepID=UPI00237E9EDC|nr:hypothetical protein [Cloacibacterium sp. TD35]WDT68504.1 hypothetical protein N7277_02575 [Cloacibacterium sp. TD35]
MKKILIFIFFPLLYFSQQKDDWSNAMQTAMKNIQNQDFKNAIINLDKSLKIVPNNWSALYFKGYSQIIIGEDKKGCQNLINSIFFGGNDYPKKVYAEKCINYDPKLNPQNFKTGKFTLQILDDKTKDSTKYEFERRNNVQYENFEGKVYSGKIIWYKNGDYTIIPTEDTEKMMTENPKFLTRILKIENNKYLYEKIEENQVQFGIVEKVE